MIEDINEVYPLTIIAADRWRPGAKNYYAFQKFAKDIPSQNEWIRFGDLYDGYTYISKLDYFLETEKPVYGIGESIKDACKDLVKKLNENEGAE